MLDSAVYEYSNGRDNGYMARFINGENKHFRFFDIKDYGDKAKSIAETTLLNFIERANETKAASTPRQVIQIPKDVRPQMLVTESKGIYVVQKNNILAGFAVKNGRANRVAFYFTKHTPQECWEMALALRYSYDRTCDINQPMPTISMLDEIGIAISVNV
jgi:hypothetical protein